MTNRISQMFHLRILGSGGGDLSPSILLHFDQKSYLFNCGEGTQRFCIQHKIKLGKISNVFFTRLSYNAMGGLPGLMLTLESVNSLQSESKTVSLFGPKGIKGFLSAIRPFTHRSYNSLELNFKYDEMQSDFVDENVEISCIKSSHSNKKRRCNSLPKKYYLSYVIKGPKVKPKFSKEKLKSFNITNPKHFKELMAMKSVTLENGTVVVPKDVFLPKKPRDVLLIIDVTLDCIEDLIEKFENVKSQILNSQDEKLKIMFHMVQDDLVLENSTYQAWMKSWGDDVKVFSIE